MTDLSSSISHTSSWPEIHARTIETSTVLLLCPAERKPSPSWSKEALGYSRTDGFFQRADPWPGKLPQKRLPLAEDYKRKLSIAGGSPLLLAGKSQSRVHIPLVEGVRTVAPGEERPRGFSELWTPNPSAAALTSSGCLSF